MSPAAYENISIQSDMLSLKDAAIRFYDLDTRRPSFQDGIPALFAIQYLMGQFLERARNISRKLRGKKPYLLSEGMPSFMFNETSAMSILEDRLYNPHIAALLPLAKNSADIRALFVLGALPEYAPTTPPSSANLERLAYQAIQNYRRAHEGPALRELRSIWGSKLYRRAFYVVAGLQLVAGIKSCVFPTADLETRVEAPHAHIQSPPPKPALSPYEAEKRRAEIAYYNQKIKEIARIPPQRADEALIQIRQIKKEIYEKGLQDEFIK